MILFAASCTIGGHMGHFQDIYAQEADRYDLLVSREDYQHHLLPALKKIRSLQGCEVVEMGAGTGRLTRLLAPHVRHIHAYDASAHMLDKARVTLAATGATNCTLAVGENHALPAEDECADIVISGWSFGHSCEWFPNSWRDEIGRALAEMKRVLRPGGTAIILETLGTGREAPAAPNETLATYYNWLEQDHGFSATPIRTDYRFVSEQEAYELVRFFFGAEAARRLPIDDGLVLPECTGVWWKSYRPTGTDARNAAR